MDSYRQALQTNEKLFPNFKFIFQYIETNSEARILIKVQCVIYQWIPCDNLYKLIEFFPNFEFVF